MTGGGLLPGDGGEPTPRAMVNISLLMVVSVSISPDDGGEPLAGWGG
jgi:hypothetical protein